MGRRRSVRTCGTVVRIMIALLDRNVASGRALSALWRLGDTLVTRCSDQSGETSVLPVGADGRTSSPARAETMTRSRACAEAS